MAKVTVIITVLNEATTIVALLDGLEQQTTKPSQVIIVDGGSTDQTLSRIKVWQNTHKTSNLLVFERPGNRSVGRNWAITHAKTELIAITDAGCIPQPQWLESLLRKHQETQAPVVAGYYQGVSSSSFAQAVIPYFLVMPDRINPDQVFLPATRSMLIKKSVWAAVGGFNEQLADNEDYEFAKRIQKSGVEIAFAQKAIVKWQPPQTVAAFFKTIYRFARGDSAAGILRIKVGLIFLRLAVGAGLALLGAWTGRSEVWWLLVALILGYLLWAIQKNAKYVGEAWWWLPVLQLLADGAVVLGSIEGSISLLNQGSRLK